MSVQHIFDKRREEAKRQKTEDTEQRKTESHRVARTILDEKLEEGERHIRAGGDCFLRSYNLRNLVPSWTTEAEAFNADAQLREDYEGNPYIHRTTKDYSDRAFDPDRDIGAGDITWTVNVCDLKK